VAVWASAYPSVVPLSRVIEAVFGLRRMMARELPFHFLFPTHPRV